MRFVYLAFRSICRRCWSGVTSDGDQQGLLLFSSLVWRGEGVPFYFSRPGLGKGCYHRSPTAFAATRTPDALLPFPLAHSSFPKPSRRLTLNIYTQKREGKKGSGQFAVGVYSERANDAGGEQIWGRSVLFCEGEVRFARGAETDTGAASGLRFALFFAGTREQRRYGTAGGSEE